VTLTTPTHRPAAPPLLARAHRLRQSRRVVFATMLLSACVSLVASFVLSVDALRLAADPGATLACDLNATISCGTVAQSWQASVLGFPNAFLGLMAEPVVLTIAVASLGGVRFPRWFMAAAQAVYTVGLLFAYWLFAQSMVVIGALCPWCLLVTVSTTLVFCSLTHINVRDDNLYLPRRVQARARAAVEADVDVLAVAVWLVLLTTLVVARYGAHLLA
jgi:uncharacterized membrane protein